jgi:hypothetical protein
MLTPRATGALARRLFVVAPLRRSTGGQPGLRGIVDRRSERRDAAQVAQASAGAVTALRARPARRVNGYARPTPWSPLHLSEETILALGVGVIGAPAATADALEVGFAIGGLPPATRFTLGEGPAADASDAGETRATASFAARLVLARERLANPAAALQAERARAKRFGARIERVMPLDVGARLSESSLPNARPVEAAGAVPAIEAARLVLDRVGGDQVVEGERDLVARDSSPERSFDVGCGPRDHGLLHAGPPSTELSPHVLLAGEGPVVAAARVASFADVARDDTADRIQDWVVLVSLGARVPSLGGARVAHVVDLVERDRERRRRPFRRPIGPLLLAAGRPPREPSEECREEDGRVEDARFRLHVHSVAARVRISRGTSRASGWGAPLRSRPLRASHRAPRDPRVSSMRPRGDAQAPRQKTRRATLLARARKGAVAGAPVACRSSCTTEASGSRRKAAVAVALVACPCDCALSVLASPLGPAGSIRGRLLSSCDARVLGDRARRPCGHSVHCIKHGVLTGPFDVSMKRRASSEERLARYTSGSRRKAAIAVALVAPLLLLHDRGFWLAPQGAIAVALVAPLLLLHDRGFWLAPQGGNRRGARRARLS